MIFFNNHHILKLYNASLLRVKRYMCEIKAAYITVIK